jgi:hypothetical protein
MGKLASLVFIGSFVATGCARNQTDLDSAAAAIDSSNSVESEGNVMAAVSDGADTASLTGPTADQVAAYIAANITVRFNPSGCGTAVATGANVVIHFNDCTGPRGLLHVTGELDLAVSVDTAGIHIHGTATGLEVNSATLDIDSTATYSVSGTTKSLAVMTTGTGTGALGNDIDHTGDYTITWDTTTQCASLDGSWSTTLSNTTASATRSNQVNVMRCAGGCPTGTVVHTGLRGFTLTINFDGTSVADWSTSTGKSGTFNLTCH